MKFIIDSADLVELDDENRADLGGKARPLAALAQQHLPIPDWFVLTATAFDHSLTPLQQQQLAAGEIVTLSTLYPSHAVQTVLAEALLKLCPNGEPVAVRSSAHDEDGQSHSFAGQLDSYLWVTPAEVPARVAEVWRSGFSDRILAYRQEHHYTQLPPPPAVLIQKMVDAESAGVAFSADPVTGQRSVAVVSAVRGLGTTLVSGESNADTYHVGLQGQILQRQFALIPKAEPEAEPKVEPEAENVAILTDPQVQAIAQLSRQVEQHFDRPQDIEWAIAAGQIFLLQSRPITTLTRIPDPDGVMNLWDNSNIVESYGGITTPLTFSFARRAYEEVYRQFCRMMGVPGVTIAQQDQTFRQMLGLLRGRIYYNLLNWYRVLALLPGFRVNRGFMEQMMGVKTALPADVLAELEGATWRDRLQDSFRLVNTLRGLLTNYLTLPRQIRQFYQRLDQALSLPQSALEHLRPDQLAAYYHDLERQLLTRWDAPLVNDFFAMIFYGVLRKLSTTWCNDTQSTLQNDLISGEGGMISAEPAQKVQQMATLAANDADFAELLCTGSLSQILPAIAPNSSFATQYQDYLQKFGDRCLEELKLESTTLHDNPLSLLRSIGHLSRRSEPAAVPESESPRKSAEIRVKQALKGQPLRSIVFNWVLSNARARVRDRENLRFERTRLFGRVRRIFVEMGRRFYGLDLLNSPRDIFYLEVNEILGLIHGTATCTNLKGLVALRQAEFEGYQHLPAPGDRFETRGIVYQGNLFQSQTPSKLPNGETLQGTGCCPGIVRAPVQVVTDPHQAELRQGCILVAERTDPGWIMLFPVAVGLLVERGSLLSHSAIVAREMGIPAIVSLPGLMHWLKDGDWVELNGSTGVVQRIPPESTSQIGDFSEKPPILDTHTDNLPEPVTDQPPVEVSSV
jgi:rifampicin phosphotransferase